jgi:hypothetical protein
MKYLSKVLSLALVVALSLGLIVTAGAIDEYKGYTDLEQIDKGYIEAIDVLSALEVIKGYEDKSFKPEREVTRAEAAKFVAYISIGTTAADKLAHRPSSFTDVPTDEWYNPFIEFGVERGLINGVGGGKFNPEGSVTGAQFAKLMLAALGYGAKDEYVGSSWELNAIVDGQTRGILTVDTDYSQPATREEVAQYAFNTIKPSGGKNFLVKLNSLINDYVLANQDSVLQSGTEQYLGAEVFGLRMDSTFRNEYGYTAHKWYKGPVVITGKYRDGVLLATSTGGIAVTGFYSLTAIDSPFYRVSLDDNVSYYHNGTPISITATVERSIANPLEASGRTYTEFAEYNTFTEKLVSAATVALAGADGSRAAAASAVLLNGGTLGAASLVESIPAGTSDGDYTTLAAARADVYKALTETTGVHTTSADFTKAVTTAGTDVNAIASKKGVIVEFVDNDFDSKADKVILIEKTVGKLAAAPGVSAAGMVSIPGVTATALPASQITYPTGLVKGDIVLYHTTIEDGIRVTHVEQPKTVTGTMTAYNNIDKAITFGGAIYPVSGLDYTFKFDTLNNSLDKFILATNGNYNLGATGYLDDNGDLVQIILDAAAAKNYLVVLGLAGGLDAESNTQGTWNYSYVVQAQVVLTDGSTKIINISKVNGVSAVSQRQFDLTGEGGNAHVFNNVQAKKGPIFSYAIDSAGNYELSTEWHAAYTAYQDNTPLNDANITPAAWFTAGVHGTGETKFIVKIVNQTGAVSYKVYTGVVNAPKYTGANTASGWVILDANSDAAVVYLTGEGDSVQAQDYVYFVNPSLSYTHEVDSGQTVTWITKAVVNGVIVPDLRITNSAYLKVMAAANKPLGYGKTYLWAYVADRAADGSITITDVATPQNVKLPNTVDEWWTPYAAIGTYEPQAYVIILGGVRYQYNSSTKVFMITQGPGGTFMDTVAESGVSEVGIIDSDNVVTVQRVADSNAPDDMLGAIYIIDNSSGSLNTTPTALQTHADAEASGVADTLQTDDIAISGANSAVASRTITGSTLGLATLDNNTATFKFNVPSYYTGPFYVTPNSATAAITSAVVRRTGQSDVAIDMTDMGGNLNVTKTIGTVELAKGDQIVVTVTYGVTIQNGTVTIPGTATRTYTISVIE